MMNGKMLILAVCSLALSSLSLAAAVPEQNEPVRRNAIVMAVEKAAPAVVNVSTETIVQRRAHPFFGLRDPFFDDLFSDFFNRYGERRFKTTSLGSGVLVDETGLVMTNDHVVRRASKITVTLHDQKQYEATLLSEDPESDLAVLRIQGEGPFPAIEMAHANDLMIGETAIALGNPFGLQSTVTVGVVSAKDRSIYVDGREAYKDLIQTDAAINPGNSGGPLVNVFGQLIGINTAIYAEAQGIGFAIPADRVRKVLHELLDSRLIRKTVFGATLDDLTPERAKELGLAGAEKGAIVTAVEEGSPAGKAGLAVDDVIVLVEGRPVVRALDVLKAILTKAAGESVKLESLRGEKRLKLTVTLTTMPEPSGLDLARKRLGLTVQTLTPALAERLELGVKGGVLVSDVEPNSPASSLLARGDVIVAVNEARVEKVEDLGPPLEPVKPGQQVNVQFVRGRFVVQVSFTAR